MVFKCISFVTDSMGRLKQGYVRYLLKPLCGILYFWMFGISSQGCINESRDSSTLYEAWKNRTKIIVMALEVDCKFNEVLSNLILSSIVLEMWEISY